MSYASDWETLADVQDAQEARKPHLHAALSPEATYGLADDWTTEHDLCRSSLEYEGLQHRWAENGQSFRLLDLSPELREKIYEFVIGRELVPRFKTGDKGDEVCTWGIGKKYEPGQWYYRTREVEKPNLALLQISKQVRYESFYYG